MKIITCKKKAVNTSQCGGESTKSDGELRRTIFLENHQKFIFVFYIQVIQQGKIM
jgi:hypothetical protein